MHRIVALTIFSLLLSGCVAPGATESEAAAIDPHAFAVPEAFRPAGVGLGGLDAVVVAVIDSRVNPYHLEWRASDLPQHRDADVENDVPLDRPPHEWLSGFPDPVGFASYEPVRISLVDDPEAEVEDLLAADDPRIPTSDPAAVHYRWIPGTKMIGVVDFRGTNGPFTDSNAHGARTSSVSVGSRFGACPECLLVFIQNDGTEDAIAWALSQPWIDVVTNSYGYSATSTGTVADRHFVYDGCDLALQRSASERGLTLFWSGSNGLVAGRVPGTTLQSCQFGPDWTITVGGIEPDDTDAYWSGKPVDVAAPAQGYPSQGGTTVGGEGTIGGTSAATPIVAGMYARGLWFARAAMEGPSRAQSEGIVATGAFACGFARQDCELGDGTLTAVEMRTRLLHAAERTTPGFGTRVVPGSLPVLPEGELLSEGHGSFLARRDGDERWSEETRRIVAPLRGEATAPARAQSESDWFVVDSYCRQQKWGEWTGGYFVAGDTSLPHPDPAWPVRTGLLAACAFTAT